MVPDSTSSLSGQRSLRGEDRPAFDSSRFRYVTSLGSGAVGSVCLAEDTNLHRKVAIKTFNPEVSRDPEFRKRIERECLLHAKVGPHTHIVTLFDRIESGPQIHLIMEFVDGETLQSLLDRNCDEGMVLPIGKALGIGLQCLEALSRIHAQGIIHRDIKPSNVMISHLETGEVVAKLMDFGVARMADNEDQLARLTTVNSGGPGTPIYMAPEQIDSSTFGDISPATDVYAMGVLLFQMLSGSPPFRGTLTEVLNAHVNIPAPRLDVVAPGRIPPVLADVLQQALAKRPEDRYATVRAFQVELLHAHAHLMHPNNLESSDWTVPQIEDVPITIRPRRLVDSAARLAGTSVDRTSVWRKRDIGKRVLALMLFVALASMTCAALLSAFRGSAEDTARSQQSGPIGAQMATKTEPRFNPTTNGSIPSGDPPSTEAFVEGRPTPLRIPEVAGPAPLWYIQLAQMDWRSPAENVVLAPDFISDDLLKTVAAVTPFRNGSVVKPAHLAASAMDSVVLEPAALESTGNATEPVTEREYVVQPGDSLSKIAGQYGINVRDLQWWNGIRNANAIAVGQSLRLYASDDLPPREQFFIQVAQRANRSQEQSAPSSNPDEPVEPRLAAERAPTPLPAATRANETNNPIKKLWRKVRGKD